MSDGIINPLWLRIWHGVQALLLIALVASGTSMHYADTAWAWISFQTAIKVHNFAGTTTGLFWVFFVIANAASGRYQHYVPGDIDFIHSATVQLRYYAIGMFRGDAPPISIGLRNNHLQQLVYAIVMYALMPISVASGLLLLFPLLAPDHLIGRPGLWPIAIVHLSVGYLLTLFTVVHIYLATTGVTFFALSREMITGVRTSGDNDAPGDERPD